MELRQLEYFRAIVDAGTISGAARMLHMTQPPLSYQIKMLEEELQVPLLIRGTKKITLTEAGKTLYEQAGTLLMLADLTRREVVKSSQSATLHIGMTPSTVSAARRLSAPVFRKQHPQIHFDVHEGSTFALKDQLENHVIDLTTLRTPIVLNGCETKTLLKESITAMALPSHPLFAGRETLSLTELAEQPLILSNRYRKYMLSAFEQAGLFCDIYLTCEDARTAMTMAEKGLGIALLPASMLNLTHKLKACTITDADLTTEILLAWRKGRLPSELRAFLELWDENDSLNNQIHVPQP
ncbi:MAG: LysR family transcriptional regulator [Fusicatenibacter saccharivorans]